MAGRLDGKTVVITGASRGIGAACAERLAREGANLVLAAKTLDDSGQHLKGTLLQVASAIEAAGGQALAVQVDVRDEAQVESMVARAVERFGRIDALINNAGAIKLAPVERLPVKRFDLLWQVNVRAAYTCSHNCIPHLRAAGGGHIINMSPPVSLATHWLEGKTGYTITKYGMSLLTLGMAEELRAARIAVNSLWPRTTIATAAVDMLGGEALMSASRTPEIMADAVYAIVSSDPATLTGRLLVDEDFLRECGQTEFDHYAVTPGATLTPDFYIES